MPAPVQQTLKSSQWNRREILGLAVSASVGSTLLSTSAQELPAAAPSRFSIIDTNVNLFRWPFRRLPLDETSRLRQKLKSLGINQALAGSFDGILHRDITDVNRRLAQECERSPELIPVGSINPALPGWEEDLVECFEKHRMPGVRVHPSYHGYDLRDDRFRSLLELVAQAGRFLQLAAAIEDVRTQPNLVRVPDVDLQPLVEVCAGLPTLRLQILNAKPRGAVLESLAEIPGLFFDTARVDGSDGVPQLVRSLPPGRVLFGTHAPFLIPEAALIRTHESSQLNEAELRGVLGGNAQHLVGAKQS